MPAVWGGIVGGTEFAGGVSAGSTTGGSITGGSIGGSTTTGPGSTGIAGFATASQSAPTLSACSASPVSLPAPHVSESVTPSLVSTRSSPSPRLIVAGARPQVAELVDSLQHP